MHRYPVIAPAHHRYQYCPLCRTALTEQPDSVNAVPRPRCPDCGWIYYPPNTVGALAVVEAAHGVVVIQPPECAVDAPAALPGGIAEYGESPEECAVREVGEETGLDVRIVAELCRFLDSTRPDGSPLPFGPMLQFGFVAETCGGELSDGDEGSAHVYAVAEVPPIAPTRAGSQRVFAAYRDWLTRRA